MDITADIAFAFAAQGRFEEAESLLEDNLARARIRHRWDEGRTMDALGGLNRIRGDHQAAIYAHLKALEIWRLLNARTRMLHSLKALAELYKKIDLSGTAETYHAQHALLAERLAAVEGIAGRRGP